MEIPTALFGTIVLLLSLAWMTAPTGRWRVRRSVLGAGLLLLIVAVMLGYSRSIH